MEELQNREFLTGRAIRFFDRYGLELKSISKLLRIRLSQLALAYTIENNLPRESIVITTRVKTLKSFLKKLEKKNWPEFYYPTEVITDLIGARITCWFLDDCYGILDYIKNSKQFRLVPDSLEDYIHNPKPSGYRSIHLLANISYDKVKTVKEITKVVDEDMTCEVQIRTKLQDAWGDLTHEFHYKAKEHGKVEANYDKILAQQAERLCIEDKSFTTIRDMYQKLIEETSKPNRKGFTDEG